ncbi:hypothetical protein DVJ83_03590 [Deinococcus wulumuqiensis]|uniref:Carboxypeptidase regulatory-like domain-containing protein n=1 Tax=Deinococcus wulumuqiensis TaxID=980427 RepID=A0A345IFC7_9DEIO|nr:hypothetical protein [Deinococcus wulumuqiensis]AXG98399.1 hypothetical protein DVJ83_03590 [Deinococcus wulumuqiensis]
MKKISGLVALGLTLSLASCGGGPAPVPTESDPPVTQISGHVMGGSGSGTVTLPSSRGTLAQAPVDAQGNFVLTLPGAEKFAADLKTTEQVLSGIGCEGQLTSSVPAAKGYAVATLNAERTGLKDSVYAANLEIQYLPPKGKLTAYAWLYTDRATHLTGNLNCSKLVNNALQINLGVDVQTRSGWNVIEIYAEGLQSMNGNMRAVFGSSNNWRTATELRAQLPF